MVISDNAEAVLRKEIGDKFELREESIGEPDIYLGGKLRNRFMLRLLSRTWKAFLRSKARSCRGLIEREHP